MRFMQYSQHATDVVGYSYNADIWCPRCILDTLWDTPNQDNATVHERGDTETMLDELAPLFNVSDRYDERSFDSNDFPKVIFSDMAHDVCRAGEGYEPGQCGDSCGRCWGPLGGSCPNQEED